LSFRLPALPGEARVTRAELVLSRKERFEVGSPSMLGPVNLDISLGGFSGDPALQLGDFDASADLTEAGRLQDGSVARAGLGGAALEALSVVLAQGGAIFQVRLQTGTATDGNRKDDYVYYYSGDQGTESLRPALILEYQLAD
jgi:hypothetical protein